MRLSFQWFCSIILFLVGHTLVFAEDCPCNFDKFPQLKECHLMQNFEPNQYECVTADNSNSDLLPIVFYGSPDERYAIKRRKTDF